jgi:tyrosinase
MASLSSIQERTWALFLRPSPPARAAFVAQARTLEAEGLRPIARFSIFDERHLEHATEVAAELMRLAGTGSAEEGLEAALDRYEDLQGQENPDLLDYALMVLITHHPRARALAHAIPPITLRNPELVAPSVVAPERAVHGMDMLLALRRRPEDESVFSGGALPTDQLEWYREDPFANEHHIHWHVVYPGRGIPDPSNPAVRRFKDRQGEIFLYMHQQMLARYDAERVALTLLPVAPLADYRAPIEVGYDPGPYVEAANLFFPRQPRARMVDLALPDGSPYTVGDHETVRRRLTEALDRRKYVHVSPPVPMVNPPTGPATEPSRLGATLEATDAGVRPVARSPYGSLHNPGHNMISGASTDELRNRREGVMFDQGTAIRDTSFWEWHKHIDDFCAGWQEHEDPRTFADRPPVRLRKRVDPADGAVSSPDLLLVFEDQLPEEARHNPDHLQEWPNLGAWAQARFGGDRWDDDGSAAGLTTATLETSMLQRPLTLSDRVTTVPLGHLTHRPFVYVLRLENTADRRVQVTVRIFLVPSSRAEERRAWIEMDKFVQALEPLEKAAVARRGAQSSVIRKPANMTPQLFKAATMLLTQNGLDAMVTGGLPGTVAARLQPFVGRVALLRTVQRELGRELFQVARPFLELHATIRPGEQPQAPTGGTAEQIEAAEAANYCTCGWPYNLLLPRGTPEGMPFRLAVVCTDWEIDRTPTEEAHPCGSVSFCGALDVYPDVRPMGYPFDRRFAGSISDAIRANDNMAARDLRIRQLPDRTVDD